MRLETQFRRCDLCTSPQQVAVTECQLCGRDLCVLHSAPLRLLPGMGCAVCRALARCGVCGKRARNRCGNCGRSLCRLHTQELCGSVACGRCSR